MRASKRLHLFYVVMKATGLKALLASPDIGHIEDLDISANHDLGDAGILLLAKATQLEGLKRLDIAGTGMSDKGAAAIAGAAHLAGLEVLRVNATGGMTESGLDALRTSAHVGDAVEAGLKMDTQEEAARNAG